MVGDKYNIDGVIYTCVHSVVDDEGFVAESLCSELIPHEWRFDYMGNGYKSFGYVMTCQNRKDGNFYSYMCDWGVHFERDGHKIATWFKYITGVEKIFKDYFTHHGVQVKNIKKVND